MRESEIKELLVVFFTKTFGLQEVDWGALSKFSIHKIFPKDTVVKRAMETERNLYLIVKGSTGNFVYRGGKPICVELCYEGDFFGDYISLLTQQSSNIETRTLEKTALIVLPFAQLMAFYQEQAPIVMEQVGRKSAEFLLILRSQQLLDLQCLSAEERYQKLLATRPEILQRTALKHIASYLGITPESFSRIRKKIG